MGNLIYDPNDPNSFGGPYVPDDIIAQQYNLAKTLRQQPAATSWAGVIANGLGAVGGNLVQGAANNAIRQNQELRRRDIQSAANAGDMPALSKALLGAATPELQDMGLKAKIQQISDDPYKEYRVRDVVARQYGLAPGTQAYRDFVLTGKAMSNGEMFGKAGAIFQDPQSGKFYSIQFGGNGQKLVEEIQAPGGASLAPAKGVENVGDELISKATGQTVRNIAPSIAAGESAKAIGRQSGEGLMNLPKAKTALDQYEAGDKLVSDNIDKAIKQADGFTTGFVGSLTSNIPGTKAYDLSHTLNAVKSNLGFDKLQEMRANSPTGGALGQVSDFENRLLQAVWGSIEQSQSKEQLVENLNKVKALRQKFRDLKRQAYERDVARFGAQNVPNPETGKLPELNNIISSPLPSGSYRYNPETGKLEPMP